MNVASLELCKELFELSGWRSAFSHGKVWNQWLAGMPVVQDATFVDNDPEYSFECPAYDLGYLLGKLQSYWPMAVYIGGGKQNDWSVSVNSKYHVTPQEADIPENAAARLAIELFKQGILTKGDK